MGKVFVKVPIPERFDFGKNWLRVSIEFGKNGRVKKMVTITEEKQ